SNRVVNILRPKCANRHFLDLLLGAGYKEHGIPSFCYSVRLKEISDNHQKSIPLISDITIFLSDFYRLFDNIRPRFNPKTEFAKILQGFNLGNYNFFEQEFVIVAFAKNIVFCDLKRELVMINPFSWRLVRPELIKSIIETYAKEYGFQVTVGLEYESFIVVTFNFGKTMQIDPELMNMVTKKSDYLMTYDPETNELTGEIHLPSKESGLRPEESGIPLSEIENLFTHLSSSLVGTAKPVGMPTKPVVLAKSVVKTPAKK
ncbi:MAG TPA: hypothetical protein VJ044_11205, partial [Candidatus Hodarchaeales archaeon]|nr:hypothetical protein [Candidatus Hodarchaeales archaeon]